MENKKLTEAQSLELITSMTQDSRARLARNVGTPFLIWGYTAVAMLIVTIVMQSIILGGVLDGTISFMLLSASFPLLTPIIAFIIILTKGRKEKGATYIKNPTMRYLWLAVGIASFLLIFTSSNYYIVTLLLSIGTLTTGFILKQKEFKVCGIIGIALSVIFPLIQMLFAFGFIHATPWVQAFNLMSNVKLGIILHMVTIILIVVTTLIIPGHILNKKCSQ